MKTDRHDSLQVWHVIVAGMMSAAMIIGLVSCRWFEDERENSPTASADSAFELGNYAQQSGQSRVVTVNGAQHQINGMIGGSLTDGGLYIEINEQSNVGSPSGMDQVAVSLQDVKITIIGLPSGVSAISVSSNGTELGQYPVSDTSVEIPLTTAQWTQWFGPTHYAVHCATVGADQREDTIVAVSGRLPSGEVVTFGKGFCPACPPCYSPGTSPGTSPSTPLCPGILLQEYFEGSFPPAGWTVVNNVVGGAWQNNVRAKLNPGRWN